MKLSLVLATAVFSCLIGPLKAQVLTPEPELSLFISEPKLILEKEAHYCLINFELKNNTLDEIEFRTWSCSWQGYFSINKMELKIVAPFCDKNFPETKNLAGQEVWKRSIKLKLNPGYSLPIAFKLGMDFIRVLHEEKLSDSGVIIWSNEVTIVKQ